MLGYVHRRGITQISCVRATLELPKFGRSQGPAGSCKLGQDLGEYAASRRLGADEHAETTQAAMTVADVRRLSLCGPRPLAARRATGLITHSALIASVQYVPAPAPSVSYVKSYKAASPAEHTSNFDKDCRTVEVQNARLAAQKFCLDQHGFTLASLDLADIDWQNADEVRSSCARQTTFLSGAGEPRSPR